MSHKELKNLPQDEQKLVEEFIKDIQKGKDDPVYFSEHILGISLHEGQKHWLKETIKEGRRKNILVPGNRFGKTFVTGVKHIWMNYYKIGVGGDNDTVKKAQYDTLNLASHSEQANAMPKMMRQILHSQLVFQFEGKWQTNKCKISDFLPEDGISENPIWRFKFKNGATFKSRTSGDDRGGAIQGAFFYFISYDECCRSHKLEEEIEPDILPRLYDTGGPLDLLSTPDMDSPSLQYYYELCEMGKERENGWFTQEGKTTDNTFIAEERHKQGAESITNPETRKQVISGNFVFSGGRMFSGMAIRNIWKKELIWEELPIILVAKQRILGRPMNGARSYVMAVDFARSESGDATVAYILDSTTIPYEIICGYRIQGVPINSQVTDLTTLKNYYNCRIVFDRNGLGGRIMEDLLAGLKPIGFDFKGREKGDMLLLLKKAISEEKIIAPEPTQENSLYYLRRELGAYKEEDSKLKTDTVMSLGMAIYVIDSVPKARIRKTKMFKRLNYRQ